MDYPHIVLKKRRKALGVTQKRLAELHGSIHWVNIGKIENGRANYTHNSVKKLLDTLDEYERNGK